ncbi:MAG: hypothetical protein Q7S79_03680 [bacterium]|nr:hypothetical protein [bacterium]
MASKKKTSKNRSEQNLIAIFVDNAKRIQKLETEMRKLMAVALKLKRAREHAKA